MSSPDLRRSIEAAWAARGSGRRLPTKAPAYDVEDGGVPRAMELGTADETGWIDWRVLDPAVGEDELRALDRLAAGPLPAPLRDYLCACCHLLELSLPEQSLLFPSVPSDDPTGPIREHLSSWPSLVPHGFVPFAEYGDGWGPVCFDRRRPCDDGDSAVVWFDHEALHRLDDPDRVSRATLEALARPLAASTAELLARCLRP